MAIEKTKQPAGSIDLFKAVQDSTLMRKPVVSTGVGVSPYVQFAHNAAKNYKAMMTALGSVPDGHPILVANQNTFTRLEPFEFLLVPAFFQYYGRSDDLGNILEIQEVAGRKPDGRDWAEFIDAVMILKIGNDLQPARIRFRGPKCPAFKGAMDSITNDVTDPDFGKRSRDHAKVAGSKTPSWAWLLHTATIQRKQPRDPKARPYDECTSSSTLTPLSVLNTTIKLQGDDSFVKVMQDCLNDHTKRVAELEAL